ncbi:MAG: adenylate/guanylate cyclase domain-containing protein [Frankiaceae bacterium]|nr:adenylate/guanylate cyclase domain-containing protein [Frankiaceae bacterium]
MAVGEASTPPVSGMRRPWTSGKGVLIRATVSLLVSITLANVFGAIAVFVLAVWVVPEPTLPDRHAVIVEDLIVAAVYFAVAITLGVISGFKRLSSLANWLPSDRAPTRDEQLTVLRGPRTLARATGAVWAGAAVIFGGLAMARSVDAGLRIGTVIAISGLITGSVTYRFAELLLREAAGRALSASPFPQRIAQSVAVRSMATWLLGTGAPVLGVVLLGLASIWDDSVGSRHELAVAMAVLGGNCLVAGAITTFFATRATADPIVSVRRALARIEQGDLDVSVPVYDGTDVGLLQAGFNRMVAGLREREELRDLFGRHVGVDVARQALEQGVELGGEQRHVAVLFIDIVGSTKLALQMRPTDVVDLLNRFFGIVVDVVEAHGGFINKFVGDAALAIFGAPAPLDDADARALRAARALSARVAAELPDLDFGIGVASGLTVAGNIGATSRLEYTVIGDPVNEAARLAEIAKTVDGRVAAAQEVVTGADGSAGPWVQDSEIVLRGRDVPTAVYTLGDGAAT